MENVWEYPQQPSAETCSKLIRVVFAGETIATSQRTLRVLEKSHPPVYYIPREDVRVDLLERVAGRRSLCEFKGLASYWTVRAGDRISVGAAWSYESPTPNFRSIAGCLAFYAGRMDECTVDGELVRPQPGDFYGGWITAEVHGPFKSAG